MKNLAKTYDEYDFDYEYDDTSYQHEEVTEAQCIEWCKSQFEADPTATGCRFDEIHQRCVSFRGADIENGDNQNDIICWKLAKGTIDTIYIKYFPIHKHNNCNNIIF